MAARTAAVATPAPISRFRRLVEDADRFGVLHHGPSSRGNQGVAERIGECEREERGLEDYHLSGEVVCCVAAGLE